MISWHACKHSLVATYYLHIAYSKKAKSVAERKFAYGCQPIHCPS